MVVYYVEEMESLPVHLANASLTNDISSKMTSDYKVELQINIWSEYRGKYEINRIAERIMSLLCSMDGYIDCTTDGFVVHQNDINMYEAYPENGEGYSGVLSLECYVKDIL